ncbi:MAG: ABC transporter ATP-binding protein, partial [Thomasclavelia spiroformis]
FIIVMPKFKIVQSLIDKLNLTMRENLSGMLVIRAFGNEEHSEQRFDKANSDLTKVNLFVNRTMVSMMPIMMFIFNIVSLLIVYYGAKQIDLGNIAIGQMMAFMQYAMQIIMSFLMIAMIAIMLPRASVAANRIYEVLSMEVKISDPKNPESFDENKKGLVEFKNVTFKYPGANEAVLENISFTAKPGETTAFIGSTGSGKSTLINLIPRFYEVTDGKIEVDGVDIRNVNQHDLRDKIGLVPQKGLLFSGTIRSNLTYGAPEASDEELEEVIKIAQAKEFIDQKEKRLDDPISQGGTNVSGGQKQRLAIARAIAKKPEIFIFDDSFSALDFKTDAKLRNELNKMIEKTRSTVLIVGQRIASIMSANQIIVLDEGKIVGKGTHDELMKNCKVYQEIAYSQLSKEELGHE